MTAKYDCIVIGGGHAGAEAAHASAKIGLNTLLLTISRDTIAKMSCNPAIGGIGKGQIVREIDALGGIMGKAIDATGIQFRILNLSKGPAVQSPRAQADKYKYKDYVRQVLESTDNLTIEEGIASDILADNNAVTAVKTLDNRQFDAPIVIVTAGTFLKGLMHIGTEQIPGGRLDEPASNELSDSLKSLGLEVDRLKTGTPARLDSSTIDYDKLEIQPGDEIPKPFSFMNDKIESKQIPCWITYTNEKIHELLRDCIDSGRAPLYTDQIKSTGARYCPSIETKIMRFADKTRHQIFLEPEDTDNTTIYCNGISTSVPRDVQDKMLKLVPGAENAKIVHYGYAIEYDYCPPVQLKINLETKKISGLFLAGQVNGTSGYEEAGAQGIVAGINAAMKLQGKEPIIIRRDQGYTGVMIDDLLTRGVDEPYRMFTSRAEYRLILRADNADRRLTPMGREVGLVDDDRWKKYNEKIQAMAELEKDLRSIRQGQNSLWLLLKRPDSNPAEIVANLTDSEKYSANVIEALTIQARYKGYLVRQQKVIDSFLKLESHKIPESIDYADITHFRAEAREKLIAYKPYSLAQASRISGITPADIIVLQIYLRKTSHKK